MARGHARWPGRQLRRGRRARPGARRVRQPAGTRGVETPARAARPGRRAPDCAAHARAAGTEAMAMSEPEKLEIAFGSLADATADGFTLVDVRDSQERIAEPMPGSLHLPMSKLLTTAAELDLDRRYLLVCATGRRSGAAADLLRSQGFRACRSLRGGLKGLKSIA